MFYHDIHFFYENISISLHFKKPETKILNFFLRLKKKIVLTRLIVKFRTTKLLYTKV